jgi:hypothetical protein
MVESSALATPRSLLDMRASHGGRGQNTDMATSWSRLEEYRPEIWEQVTELSDTLKRFPDVEMGIDRLGLARPRRLPPFAPRNEVFFGPGISRR